MKSGRFKNYKGIDQLKNDSNVQVLAIAHCSKKWLKQNNIDGYTWWLAIWKTKL